MTKADVLANELRSSRERLSRVTAGLDGTRLLGPKLSIVNPPLWELGHVAWFQEYWCLRRSARGMPDSILKGADTLYDSAKVAHDTRWNLPLPGIEATRAYQANVLERVLRRLEAEPDNRELAYFVQLAIFHEDMHAEAFHYTRQTLGYEDPYSKAENGSFKSEVGSRKSEVVLLGDAALPGGAFMLGATPDDGFVFDNEKWAHEVRIPPFHIARVPVTNAEFAAFVDAGGYSRREWWSDEGWAWKLRAGLAAPKYWAKRDGTWSQRRFDRAIALTPDEPVTHVNWHEAQAYCRYAERRLPSEAEWEYAASWHAGAARKQRFPWGDRMPAATDANLDGTGIAEVGSFPDGDTLSSIRQLIGNVWEWTASSFDPYPEFVADPYKEYSEPWFGTHKVLRGGSFATPRRLIRNTWRNFYTPDRSDVFAGFRTCALEI